MRSGTLWPNNATLKTPAIFRTPGRGNNVYRRLPSFSSRARHSPSAQRAIVERLTTHPDLYGKPLRRSLKGYRKLRVGDYRVVFKIEKNAVKILIIQHRSTVYTQIGKRI